MQFSRSLYFSFILFATACGSQSEPSYVRKVIGGDDRQTLSNSGSHEYSRPLKFLGRMDSDCSLIAVSSTIAVTAAHCVISATGGNFGSNLDCRSHSARWWGTNPGAGETPCKQILRFRWDDTADFAVLEMNEANFAGSPPPMGNIREGSDLFLLEVIDSGRSQVSSCRMLGNLGNSPERFRHDCDTNPGSSGSAIFDRATGSLVGIHNGAATENWNIGTRIGAAFPGLRP